MNRLELQKKLIGNEIDERFFSLDGKQKDECLILEFQPPQNWIVYYSEKGLRTGELYFDSEDAACTHIFQILLRDPTVKKIKTDQLK